MSYPTGISPHQPPSCGDQLRHHPIHDAARVGAAAPRGRQGVQLIEEQNAGRQVPGILEERPAELCASSTRAAVVPSGVKGGEKGEKLVLFFWPGPLK